MKITRLEPLLLNAPVTRGGIADSTHRLAFWGAPGVAIHTDAGLVGYGFSGTHAHRATDVMILDGMVKAFGPLLLGEDPLETLALWEMLHKHPPITWVGRAGITQLALGAIDIALWDLKAKKAGMPLWKLLGGSAKKRVEAYNTDGGWLNWSRKTLVADCKRMVEKEGYGALKIKVGGPDPEEDVARLAAVRKAVGSKIRIMTDANGHWNLPQAIQMVSQMKPYNVTWIEEPIYFDDVLGHQRLAASSDIPIALGEQIYTLHHFRDFIHAGAVHYVQPDVTRLGGITEFWQVADLAHAFRLPVVPHVGDMGQVHQHLCFAHAACQWLEFIPWLSEWMEEPVRIQNGYYVAPKAPGAGMTPNRKAFDRMERLN